MSSINKMVEVAPSTQRSMAFVTPSTTTPPSTSTTLPPLPSQGLILEHSQATIEDVNLQAHKPSFCFMDNRQKYRIIIDDNDCTPDDIIDKAYVTMEDVFSHAAYETKNRLEAKQFKTMTKSQPDLGMKVYATTINLDDIHIDHTLDTEEGYPPTDIDVERAPSAFYIPRMYPLSKHPKTILVTLKETETHYLFGQPSFSYDKATPEGALIEEENESYAYITVGKGRNRKMVSTETQTKPHITQTRHTLSTRPQKRNAMCFASAWDMLDTYAQLAQVTEEEEPDEMVLYQSAAAYLLRKKRLKNAIQRKKRTTFAEISETPAFYDAVLLTQRALAAKEYSDAQKRFRGLITVDLLSLDLLYIYTMKPLWKFECPETAGRPISCISFNSKNQDILAVGYGRFAFAETFTGIVCIWCTKNPCLPERLYRFSDPLSSLAFSELNPNWLACGFTNGDELILDVTSYFKKIVAMSTRDTNPCFEPVWVTQWRVVDPENEYVMTACQDGRINRFSSTKTHDFICSPMMRISAVEGKMKGLETTKPCIKMDVPITRYPAALCMRWHPSISHVYLVGTEEGCIHKCSTHYLNQHMDVYRAHAGPVYCMEYSPFMSTLLVTCGADCAIRLWIEGMDDVIMTLNCSGAVYGISFCPINSTILISVSGNVMSVWDLRRKTHIPCADLTFGGAKTLLTYVKFSASGDNLFVGDSTGKVYTFHLEDTPIPPYYQHKMLDEAIKKSLCTRPVLLKQLEKLERARARQEKKK